MSDPLPALGRGVINSVIALFGRPPPLARSKKGKPVVKTEAAGAERAGNRSESAFRRSIMTAGVAMTNHATKEEYVQENIYAWRERSPPWSQKKNADARRPPAKIEFVLVLFLPPLVL